MKPITANDKSRIECGWLPPIRLEFETTTSFLPGDGDDVFFRGEGPFKIDRFTHDLGANSAIVHIRQCGLASNDVAEIQAAFFERLKFKRMAV